MESLLRTLFEHGFVLVALIFFTAWLLGTTVGEIRKYACHRKDVELKRDLADRGLSAEEIERIIAVNSSATNETAEH
jgi:hypothetical protein